MLTALGWRSSPSRSGMRRRWCTWDQQGAAKSCSSARSRAGATRGRWRCTRSVGLRVIVLFAFVSATLLALLGMPQLAVLLTPAVLMLSSAFYALYFHLRGQFRGDVARRRSTDPGDAMSMPGRPKCKFRTAQHGGSQ